MREVGARRHASLDSAHRLMPGVDGVAVDLGQLVRRRSRAASSAATFCSSCSTLEAPISAEVTRGSRSVHAIAICASDWPRRRAISASARTRARFSSVRKSRVRKRPSRGARVLGHAVEVLLGQHPLAERREDDRADPLVAEHVEQLGLDPAVQQRVGGLVDQHRRAELAHDRGGLARALGRVGRDARVERLALAHRAVERAERLAQRRVGVEAVRVEDVDVVQAHARRGSGRARPAGTCASPTRRTGPGHMS